MFSLIILIGMAEATLRERVGRFFRGRWNIVEPSVETAYVDVSVPTAELSYGHEGVYALCSLRVEPVGVITGTQMSELEAVSLPRAAFLEAPRPMGDQYVASFVRLRNAHIRRVTPMDLSDMIHFGLINMEDDEDYLAQQAVMRAMRRVHRHHPDVHTIHSLFDREDPAANMAILRMILAPSAGL